MRQTGPPSPPLEQSTVTVHALSGGHFTLPEYQFVHPVSQDARKTVPSLAFLIQHHNFQTGKVTRIVFDLGLRRDIRRYAPPIQKHVETRQPMTTDPDVVKSLARGGLTPEDIDYVLYSHVCRFQLTFTNTICTRAMLTGSSLGTLGSYRRAAGLPLFNISCRQWRACAS